MGRHCDGENHSPSLRRNCVGHEAVKTFSMGCRVCHRHGYRMSHHPLGYDLSASRLVGWHSTSVGVLWAMISTVFVYKDTRTHSLYAGISRLIATFAGFALCLIYLSLLPATTIGMGALIAIGVLLMSHWPPRRDRSNSNNDRR